MNVWHGRVPYKVAKITPVPVINVADREVHKVQLCISIVSRTRIRGVGGILLRIEATRYIVGKHVCATVS